MIVCMQAATSDVVRKGTHKQDWLLVFRNIHPGYQEYWGDTAHMYSRTHHWCPGRCRMQENAEGAACRTTQREKEKHEKASGLPILGDAACSVQFLQESSA